MFTLYILAGFLLFYEADPGPEIPFENLSKPLKSDVNKHLDEGRLALKYQDYNGAIFSFDKAYALHPRNLDAVNELSAIVDSILSLMHQDQSPEKLVEYQNEIIELLKYESLSQNKQLNDEKDRLIDLLKVE